MIQFNKFINGTNLEHVGFSLLFAAVLGAVIWLLTGDLGTGIAVGCGFGAGFFVGREHDQAEYRWIETLGSGRRANMPWWGGLDPRVWGKLDCWMDWVLPVLACSAVFWLSWTYL